MGHRLRLAGLLARPRYEVLALPGAAEKVQEHVPAALPVTVTASPRKGLEPTLALTETLAGRGYSTIPHLAARLVHDDVHLTDILRRLDEAGVRDVFVVAGDGDVPVGDFVDSLQLLTAIERQREPGSFGGLRSVGVTGYPEGHPLVSDAELDRALLAKQSLSSYVVTQMCFDVTAVHRWIGHARELDVRHPVHVGVAGAVDRLRLLTIAGRIGVGSSISFLRKHHGVASLLRPGYRGDDLVLELASDASPPDVGVAGLHVYTFGDVAATERWRLELLDQLTDGGEHG